MKNSYRRRVGAFLVAALVLAGGLLAGRSLTAARAEDTRSAPTDATTSAPHWPDEVVDLFAYTSVLHGGRVMPLEKLAVLTLKDMNHRDSCKVPVDGQSGPAADTRDLSAMEWMLDVMFFPDVARRYECFMVDNDEVIGAMGLSLEGMQKKKRDRYSYDFLAPGRARLMTLAAEYDEVQARDRDPVQSGILDLAHNLMSFEKVLRSMDWARTGPVAIPEALREFFGGAETASFDEIVERAPKVLTGLQARPDGERIWNAFSAPVFDSALSRFPSIFPLTREQSKRIQQLVESRRLDPEKWQRDEWLSPYDVLFQAQLPVLPVSAAHVDMLRDLEAMAAARGDMKTFAEHAHSFARLQKPLAKETGRAGHVALEVFLLRSGLLKWPRHLYLLAFVLVAVTWLFKKRRRWYDWFVIGPALAIPTAMLIAGVVIRSLIRGHPPINNLYDTVLFITAGVAVAALTIEWMNKGRIALALAPVFGFLGMTVAVGYDNLTREDTMRPLVAVLDTNFWLATHVTCIAIGYMAALFTAGLGNLYIVGKITGLQKGNPEFYRTLGRMLYGMLAFGLVFATVGTILGGIWANESWGRFWGWDPKENGALMIVLWQLAMIHGRLGGILKTWGLAMASTVLGCVVAFSWWGVNLLGIGLHSYGFTQGVSTSLNVFYGFEGLIFLGGTIWWLAQGPKTTGAGARS